MRRLPAALILALLPACAPPAAGSPAPMAPAPFSPPLATPTTGLGAASAWLVAHEGCADTCCLAGVPTWIEGGLEVPGAVTLDEARRALGDRSSARIQALAALRLSVAMVPDDVDRAASLVDSIEPAGAFPETSISQAVQRCYPVAWTPRTLGGAALLALGRMTGSRFATPAEFKAWRAARGDLEGSFAYWEDALASALGDRREAMLAKLREKPELLVRLALSAKQSAAYGVTDDEVARLLRERVGLPRLVRILDRVETFPELADEDRFAIFSQRTFDLAEKLRDPVFAAALVRLWETRRYPRHDFAEAALAVAASRLAPEEAQQRILVEAITRLASARGLVIEELSSRYFLAESARLEALFVRAGADQDEVRAAVLAGAPMRAGALPFLKRVVLPASFVTDSAAVIDRLMAIALAIDPATSFPERDKLAYRPLKNTPPERVEALKAESARARSEGLARFRGWLRAHR